MDSRYLRISTISHIEGPRPRAPRDRKRPVTIASYQPIYDEEALTPRTSTSSSIGMPDHEALNVARQHYANSLVSPALIPPPPNTPAGHLITRRQTLLQKAHEECFRERSRRHMRELLDNLPFRIDPVTKVINNPFVNYRSAFKEVSFGGSVPKQERGPGPKRPAWLSLLPVKGPMSRLMLRKRTRNPRKDADMPSNILKRKLREAAFDDYCVQQFQMQTKHARLAAAQSERYSLQATAKLLNEPAAKVIDIRIGETLEEKVKSELAARNGETKRKSRARLSKPAYRSPKFTEMLAGDQESINSADFVVEKGRFAKLGDKLKGKIQQLQKGAEKAKQSVKGKFGKKTEEERVPLLQVVHF